MKQVGKDYADISEVEAFDAFHGKFRDVKKGNAAIIEMLSIQEQQTFGTGTGAFAIQSAACARKVYVIYQKRLDGANSNPVDHT